MNARLRDHLPQRFQNALTMARRALHCERLESRCLLHGNPLTLACEPDGSYSELESEAPPVAAIVQRPSAQGSYAGLADGASISAAGVQGPAMALVGSDPDESDEPNGLPEPEGEAPPVPPPVTTPPAGSSGSHGNGYTPPAAGDTVVPPGHSTSPTGVGTSAPAGPVATPTDGQVGLGSLGDSLIPTTPSSSGHDGLQPGAPNAPFGGSVGSGHNIGYSLSPDVQSQSLLTLGLLAQSLQTQGVQGQSVQAQSLQTPGATSPWLFSTLKPASMAANAQATLSADYRSIDGRRSLHSYDAGGDEATIFTRYTAEEPVLAGEAANDTDMQLNELRAAIERIAQERKSQRTAISRSMREDAARHANGHLLQAYLRVREGSDGLVELAVEPSPSAGEPTDAHAAAAPMAAPHSDVAASAPANVTTGLYREFDLASAAKQSSADLGHFDILAAGSNGNDSDAEDPFGAVDAAHAEDESADGVTGGIGENTLPLGMLALSCLLAINRHRALRKQRANDEA